MVRAKRQVNDRRGHPAGAGLFVRPVRRDRGVSAMGRKLYVGNLPYQTGETELTELFSRAGSGESARIMRDMAAGRARGFGFVEMASDEDAQRAISQLNDFKMEGRPLVVNEARPKPMGGGGGGGGFERGNRSGGGGGGGGRREPR